MTRKTLILTLLPLFLVQCILFNPPSTKIKFGENKISAESALGKIIQGKEKGTLGTNASATFNLYYSTTKKTTDIKKKIPYFTTASWNKGWEIKVEQINTQLFMNILLDPLTAGDGEISFYTSTGAKLTQKPSQFKKNTAVTTPIFLVEKGVISKEIIFTDITKLKKVLTLVIYKQDNKNYYVAGPPLYLTYP